MSFMRLLFSAFTLVLVISVTSAFVIYRGEQDSAKQLVCSHGIVFRIDLATGDAHPATDEQSRSMKCD